MKKIMRKWGNSIILSFTAEECNVRDLKPGSEVNVELEATGRDFAEDSKKSLIGLMKESEQIKDDEVIEPQKIVKEAMQTAMKVLPKLLNPESKVPEYEITSEAQSHSKPLLPENPISLKEPEKVDSEPLEEESIDNEEEFDLQSMIDEVPTQIINDKVPQIKPAEEEVDKPKSREIFKRGKDGRWSQN